METQSKKVKEALNRKPPALQTVRTVIIKKMKIKNRLGRIPACFDFLILTA
jgi:hypothetical protein